MSKADDSIEEIDRLHAWYAGPVGVRYLEGVREALHRMVPGIFGYHAVQVGGVPDVDLLEDSRINRRFRMNGAWCSVRGEPESLPFAADTIDLLLLAHALEFSSSPHQVLREAERVLVPEGHVIVIGFNPFSLMGLGRLARLGRGREPWGGRYYSRRRLGDWLALLGFDVIETRYAGFVPPIGHSGIVSRLAFLDRIGIRWWRKLGGVYVLLARKRVATLTPVRPRWSARRRLVPATGFSGTTNRGTTCLRKS